MSYSQDLASGVFKFSNDISEAALVEFVQSTWKSNPGFEYLAIRGCDGDRKFGIVFTYRHAGTYENYEAFLDQCIGRLKRVFGDSCVGWDLCSATRVIKNVGVSMNARVDEVLDLGIRAQTCLVMMGVHTIEDLTKKTELEILKAPNTGRKVLNEIKDGLKAINLRLADRTP